jgi:Protein of unknown function (DUF3579)
MRHSGKKIVIEGVTSSGQIFRPTDWAERMSGNLSTFKKRRIHYSPLLQPSFRDGHKCVIIDPELEETNPALYQSILDFARNNKLQIREIDEEENS